MVMASDVFFRSQRAETRRRIRFLCMLIVACVPLTTADAAVIASVDRGLDRWNAPFGVGLGGRRAALGHRFSAVCGRTLDRRVRLVGVACEQECDRSEEAEVGIRTALELLAALGRLET